MAGEELSDLRIARDLSPPHLIKRFRQIRAFLAGQLINAGTNRFHGFKNTCGIYLALLRPSLDAGDHVFECFNHSPIVSSKTGFANGSAPLSPWEQRAFSL